MATGGKVGKHLLVAGFLLLLTTCIINPANAQEEEKEGREDGTLEERGEEVKERQGEDIPPGLAGGEEGGDPGQTGGGLTPGNAGGEEGLPAERRDVTPGGERVGEGGGQGDKIPAGREGGEIPGDIPEAQRGNNTEETIIELECEDQHPLCDFWASNSECWQNPHYMVNSCTVSCWSCPGVYDCRDNPDNADLCKAWVAVGECLQNAEWMRANCFRSCGFCRFANLTQTGGTDDAASDASETGVAAREGSGTEPKDVVSPSSSSSTSTTTVTASPSPKEGQVTESSSTSTPTRSTTPSTTMNATTTLAATPTSSVTPSSTATLVDEKTSPTQVTTTMSALQNASTAISGMTSTTSMATPSTTAPSSTTTMKDETESTSSKISTTAATKLSPTPAETTLGTATPSTSQAPSTTLSTASTVSTPPPAPTKESTTLSSAPSTSPTSPIRSSTPPAPPSESTTMKDIPSSTMAPSTVSTVSVPSSTTKASTTPEITPSRTTTEPTSPSTPSTVSSTVATTKESVAVKDLSSTTTVSTLSTSTISTPSITPEEDSTTKPLFSTTSSGTASTVSTSQAVVKETTPGKQTPSTAPATTPSSTMTVSTMSTVSSTTAMPSTSTQSTASTSSTAAATSTMAATTTTKAAKTTTTMAAATATTTMAAAATTTIETAPAKPAATTPSLQTESTTQKQVASSTLDPTTASTVSTPVPRQPESTTMKDIPSSTLSSSSSTTSASTPSTTLAAIKETVQETVKIPVPTTPSAVPDTTSTVSSTLPVKETTTQVGITGTPSATLTTTGTTPPSTTPSTSRATMSSTEASTKSSTTDMSSSTSSAGLTTPPSTTMKLPTTISTEMPTARVSTTIKTAVPSTEGTPMTVNVTQPTSTTTMSSSLEPTSPSTTALPSSTTTVLGDTPSTTMSIETTKSTAELTPKSTTLLTGTATTVSTTVKSTVNDTAVRAVNRTTTQRITESTFSSTTPTAQPAMTTAKTTMPTTDGMSSSTLSSTISAGTVSTKAATTTGNETVTQSGISVERSTSTPSSTTKLATESVNATMSTRSTATPTASTTTSSQTTSQSTSSPTPSTSQVKVEPTSPATATRSTTQESTSSVTTPTERSTPATSTVTTSSRGPTERSTMSVMTTKEASTTTTLDGKSSTIMATIPLSTAMKTMTSPTTVVARTTSSRPCVNLYDVEGQCDGWSSAGECTGANQEWMTENCYKSCGYCEVSEPTTAMPVCANNPSFDGSCDGWAELGECEKNVEWMRAFCTLSCGACETATEGAVLETPSTTVGTSSTAVSTPSPETTTMKPTPKVPTPDSLVNVSTDLLISNETHILYYNGEMAKVIVSQEKGSIVGLAVDVAQGFVFWSDLAWNTKGIYRSTLDGQDQTRIISQDIAEVNGLTVDYASGHIYWTDAVRRSIEMADYDGSNRRTVISRGLRAPRGIVADPLHGYLFWGDQGTRTISRCLLDGSDRKTIVDKDLVWPNQLAIQDNVLLFVDGWNKTLTSTDLDGEDRKQVALLSTLADDNPLFGLAVANKTAYVTSWGNGGLIKVPLVSGGSTTPSLLMEGLTKDVMFSLASTDPSGQPSGLNPCSWPDKGGCSHICLPTGVFTYRCSCPSSGGRVPRGNMCVMPDDVLLYANADLGQVTFIDPSATVAEEYIVGKSRRPVAVGYDPVDQVVYWSDVQERSIHKAYLNGSGHSVLLNASHGLGFVDGLFVDWQHRKLYFTNADFVTLDGTAFTWHKIEVVGLDGEGRRSVVTDVEQPRGLWVDMEAGYLYYTDWGMAARLVRSQLDGFKQEVLRDGLENPNDVIVTGDAIYVIDSHAKGRDAGREGAQGALYRLNRESGNWTRVDNLMLKTPFGLTNNGNKFYISDWDLGAILSYDVTTGQTSTVIDDLGEPMGVFYTAVKATPPLADGPCAQANCPDVCLTTATGGAQCACSSDDAKVQSSFGGCIEPENFVLIADLNEIRLVSQRPLDGHVYTVISGNRYAASFSALLWDAQRNRFYFSDVNRRVLYQGDLSGQYSILYDARDVIDGLALGSSGSDLYWTAQEEGAIYRLDLDKPGSNATAVVRGLSQPKALIHSPDTGELYWTEVGSMGAVRKMHEAGGEIVTLWQSVDTRPLNLFLDVGRRWVGFATRGSGSIFTCPISGGTCLESSSLPNGTAIVPSIQQSGDYLYYSNWTSGSIQRSSWARNSLIGAVTVIDGLMRPTDFVVVTRAMTNEICSSNHMCSDICVALALDYACACNVGRSLTADGRQCYDTVQSSSTAGTTRLAPSTTIVPTISDIPKTTTETTKTTVSSTQTPKSTTAESRTSTSPTMPTERSTMTETSTSSIVPSSTEGPSTRPPSTERSTLASTAGVVTTLVPQNATATIEATSESTVSTKGETKTPSIMSSTPTSMTSSTTSMMSTQPSTRSTITISSSSTMSTTPIIPSTLPSSTVSSTRSTPTPTTSTMVTPSTSSEPTSRPTTRTTQTVSTSEPTSRPTVTPSTSTTTRPTTVKTTTVTETATSPTTSRSTLRSTQTETSTMSSRMTATPPIDTTETTLMKPTFNFCPRNRTALIERGGESVAIWWLEPEAVDRNGDLVGDVKANRSPGELFKPGLTFVTYTATDSEGRQSMCTFFITVERQEFSCPGLPAPLNGDMVCKTEEFVYTCEVQCHPGYVPNTDITSIRPACRTTGWGPEFPPDYVSLSCLQQLELQQTLPVTITYSGECSNGKLTDDFKQAFTAKVVHNIRNAGLCPPVPADQDLGLCDPTSFNLKCDTGVRLRKRRQVERIRVNVTLSAPASDPTGMNEQRMSETRENLERLLLSDRLNFQLDGQPYIAQQVAPLEKSRIGCPPGHATKGNTCVLCPAGSFVGSGECESCPAGSYQPRSASYTCSQCPAGTSAPKGAFSSALCVGETAPPPASASDSSGNSLSVPIVIGLCVAAGLVLIITLVVAVCTVRRLFKSKGQMKLDQEKAMLNGSNGVRYTNPAFVARPQEETSGKTDSTPRYVAITKTGAGNDVMTMAGPGMSQQPVQYRRLPNGQVVRVVAVAAPGTNGTNTKVRMPPNKSRKYEMKHPAPVRSTPTATMVRAEDNGPAQGMYRKYQPTSGWQGMSDADKLNQ